MRRLEEDFSMMLRQYRWQMILSSILVVLPVAAGLCLLAGGAAGESGKTAAAVADGRLKAMLVSSLFCLANHFLMIWFTLRDPKNRERNQQMIGFVFWLCPIISIFSCGTLYRIFIGARTGQSLGISAGLGILFIVLGNYLPKTRQNHTVGIRVPWTLTDEENWNATHRFGGRVWVAGGFLTLIGGFLPGTFGHRIVPAALLAIAAAPIAYSYLYYRRQKKAGKAPNAQGLRAGQADGRAAAGEKLKGPYAAVTAASLGILAVIFIGMAVLLFTGNIRVEFADDAFTIRASYWNDLTVAYDEIDSVELRENGVSGYRSFGFGSARLGMGTFENEEFGSYTRYTYVGSSPCLVIKTDGETLVLNGKDEEETLAIYERLKAEESN